MTQAQQMRSEGFRASLEVRGFSVSICGQSVKALFSSVDPEDIQTRMDDNSREMSWVHVHQEDYVKLVRGLRRKVEVGDIFEDEAHRYRVTKIEDVRAHVDVRFLCEESEL